MLQVYLVLKLGSHDPFAKSYLCSVVYEVGNIVVTQIHVCECIQVCV